MKQDDINRIFTGKVAELIAKGYQINTGSMNGSEGELAKVDLCKGSEILRVLLERGHDHDSVCGEYVSIRVGRNTDPIRDLWRDTIWNGHLQTVSEIKLAKITDTFFTDMDEGGRINRKRLARWKARAGMCWKCRALGDASKSIALRWIQKQPRMKSCRLEDIESVTRVNRSSFGETLPALECYEIKARGKTFKLRARG